MDVLQWRSVSVPWILKLQAVSSHPCFISERSSVVSPEAVLCFASSAQLLPGYKHKTALNSFYANFSHATFPFGKSIASSSIQNLYVSIFHLIWLLYLDCKHKVPWGESITQHMSGTDETRHALYEIYSDFFMHMLAYGSAATIKCYRFIFPMAQCQLLLLTMA